MQMLKDLIDESIDLTPIVIAERRNSLLPLTKKVEDGIKESQIIIPILTSESISSQWVNQEIGYATALKNIRIMPIIDNSIMNDLKGFIHKEVDLSYNFQSFSDNKRKESIHFKKCITKLVNDIKTEYNIESRTDIREEISNIENTNFFFEKDYFKNLKIYNPKTQLNLSIMPFFKNSSGILNFWANVQDHHNLIKPSRRKLYIASSFSNNYMSEPNIARYPNMWAIYRETPTSTNRNGKWIFSCNGVQNSKTTFESDNLLANGWHLFSVEWSIQMDFIKFYIDAKIIGESPFSNWPEVFTMSMYIGTWPDKDPKSHFYSNISEPIFIEEIDQRIVKEIYTHKPDSN